MQSVTTTEKAQLKNRARAAVRSSERLGIHFSLTRGLFKCLITPRKLLLNLVAKYTSSNIKHRLVRMWTDGKF